MAKLDGTLKSIFKGSQKIGSLVACLVLGMAGSVGAVEGDPEQAIESWIDVQVAAANDQEVEAMMAGYSPNFDHEDGLDLDGIQSALLALWESYDDLEYQAELESWERRGPELVAVLATKVSGVQVSERGSFELAGSQTVRNRFQVTAEGDLVLINQEVLQESMTLTSGEKPPMVTVNLPDRVQTGSIYRLEAIVQEPIRDTVLLGTIIEEPVSPEQYLEFSSFPLEPLQAGGIFRQADAPAQQGADWVSVMFVSQGGVTVETRRVTVTSLL